MIKNSLCILLAILGWTALLGAQGAGGQNAAQPTGTNSGVSKVVDSPQPYNKARYEPSNRRDPFLNPLAKNKDANPDAEVPRGNPPPGIAGMNINDVKFLGTSVSPEGETAVFRGTDRRVYFLRAGDRLFDGYLKFVGADSVQLVHETKLMSGKVLTQEITKHLRTP